MDFLQQEPILPVPPHQGRKGEVVVQRASALLQEEMDFSSRCDKMSRLPCTVFSNGCRRASAAAATAAGPEASKPAPSSANSCGGGITSSGALLSLSGVGGDSSAKAGGGGTASTSSGSTGGAGGGDGGVKEDIWKEVGKWVSTTVSSGGFSPFSRAA